MDRFILSLKGNNTKQLTDIIIQIEEKIKTGLPGIDAQNRMSPILSGGDKYREVPDNHKKAGVLALIYPKDDQLHLAFIVRSSRDKRDKHAGQIGFPGGQYEPIDTDMKATAIRETYEEIGVVPDDIKIISPLTELYVFASNFLVSPYLGYIHYKPKFELQPSEVEELLEVPLSMFNDDIKETKNFNVRGGEIKDVPFYNLGGHTLWGATAMIMSEIEDIINQL